MPYSMYVSLLYAFLTIFIISSFLFFYKIFLYLDKKIKGNDDEYIKNELLLFGFGSFVLIAMFLMVALSNKDYLKNFIFNLKYFI